MWKRHATRWLSKFSRNENGSISVEALIMMPLMAWGLVATYTFFDAYRQNALNLKAAYTIGDLVSRETEVITDTYIDSMVTMFGLMTKSGSVDKIRISVIKYDEDTNKHYVDWSEPRGYDRALQNVDMEEVGKRLPIMPDEERVIVIETSNRYVPPFHVGLSITDINNFVFTRPRFTGLIKGPDDA